MGRRGAFPARAQFLHAAARPGGAKARDLSRLAAARRARRAGRRHPVRAAGRLRDAGLEPALRARARRLGDRRRAVRHQGRRAGDRDRGADPHRQARAQDRLAARAGGGGLCRHLLSGAAVSADRGGGGAHRLPGRAPGAGSARHRGQGRKRSAAGQGSLAAIRDRRAGRIAGVVGADRARRADLRSAACAGEHRHVLLQARGGEFRRRLCAARLYGAAGGARPTAG